MDNAEEKNNGTLQSMDNKNKTTEKNVVQVSESGKTEAVHPESEAVHPESEAMHPESEAMHPESEAVKADALSQESEAIRTTAINSDPEADKNSTIKSETEDIVKDIDENGILHPVLPRPEYFYDRGIGAYGFSQQGKSHIDKDVRCQDRFGLRRIPEFGMTIAAVADGVGSCQLSDLGADCAVNSSLNYLENAIRVLKGNFGKDSALNLLRSALQEAYQQVEKFADENQILLYTFQSTLTLALYDGKILYYGHAGDDGIVAVFADGTYRMVTKRHKGEEASSVYPLQSIPTWETGEVQDVVAFAMCTDGVLDGFVRNELENERVYFPFIAKDVMAEIRGIDDIRNLAELRYNFMRSDEYRNKVTDDLTIITVVNAPAIKKMRKKPEFDIAKWNEDTARYTERRNQILYGNQAPYMKTKMGANSASPFSSSKPYNTGPQPGPNADSSSKQFGNMGGQSVKSQKTSQPVRPNAERYTGTMNSSAQNSVLNGNKSNTTVNKAEKIVKILLIALIPGLVMTIIYITTHIKKPYQMNAESVRELRAECLNSVQNELHDGGLVLIDGGKEISLCETDETRAVENMSLSENYYTYKHNESDLYFVYKTDLRVWKENGLFRREKVEENLYGIIEVSKISVNSRGVLKKGFHIELPYELGNSQVLYSDKDELLNKYFKQGMPDEIKFENSETDKDESIQKEAEYREAGITAGTRLHGVTSEEQKSEELSEQRLAEEDEYAPYNEESEDEETESETQPASEDEETESETQPAPEDEEAESETHPASEDEEGAGDGETEYD